MAEMKVALEAVEERGQATASQLTRAIRAIRRNEMPSSGSGGSDSFSLCAEAEAVADAEDGGAARPDPPVDRMGSSAVFVQHQKEWQFSN